ncbi:MAG: sulfite exporter TauE/SafE family protein [Candidatus Omnitrophica bacterium]|nr:sulfite exporter TauE/SafE family protein [Candidatus Omnitrophota bacterium]
MNKEILILCTTAASIGFIHTIFGPDHYLPFIVMSKARKWPVSKTAVITFLCGIGHILSSVVLGFIGIAFGVALMKLEALEAFRGNLAAWAFIGFGFAYFVWGLHRAIRNKPHVHLHDHKESRHHHEHAHHGEHSHVHGLENKNITPWILFTIFVLGPCEPLIPILMYPAAKNSISGLILVTAAFGTVTILTMLSVVMVSSWGISFIPLRKMERYAHALAGGTICLSGLAIQFLGL